MSAGVVRIAFDRPEPGWLDRVDVFEVLETAGWTVDPDYPLSIIRCGDAVFAVTNECNDSGLTCPNGATVDFPSDTPSMVIIAACLAAVAE